MENGISFNVANSSSFELMKDESMILRLTPLPAGHGPGEAQVAATLSRESLFLAGTRVAAAQLGDSANPGLYNRLYSPLRTSLCTHSSTCPVHTHYSIRTVFSPLRPPALYPVPLRHCQPHCPMYGVMTPSSGFLVVPVVRSSSCTWTAFCRIVEPPRYRSE